MQDAHVNCSDNLVTNHFQGLVVSILVAFGCLILTDVSADELILKNGHTLRGRILSENAKQFILEVPEGKMWIRKSRVASILEMEPHETLLEECQRRLKGGTPGSAIPFLRNEYRNPDQRNKILNIYRDCLLLETEKNLDQNKLDRALELWKEYRTLPGNSARDSIIRDKIYQGQERFLKIENEIYLALEINQPYEATKLIKNLLKEFPSEQRKWNQTLAENLLEAGRRFHNSGEYKEAAPLLIEAVILKPELLNRARTAIVHCSTVGQGLSIDHARQLLPEEPAISLAAAKLAELAGNGIERAVHLNQVRGKVGQVISPVEIRRGLEDRARGELAGAPTNTLDLDLQIDQHLDRFWFEWNLPGKPPREIELDYHDNTKAMIEELGINSDGARLIAEINYGRTEKEVLHLVPDSPFLDQDALPRELFRKILPKMVGVHHWLPSWLEEGLCAISRGELARMRDQKVLEQAYIMGNLPQITYLLELEGSIEDELYRASCGSLVEWLISDVPPALLPNLLLQLTEEGLEQTLSVVTGADTLHELQQDWIRGQITGG